MKKISILTVGSRGDVEPFLAIAKGLKAVGYDVRLVTHPDFISLAEKHNIKLTPIRMTAKDFVRKTMHPPESNLFSFIRIARGVLEPILDSVLPDMWLLSRDSDAIISSGTALWGIEIAERLDVPHILAGLQPLYPTAEFPQVLAPSWFNLKGLPNRISYSVVSLAYWQIASRSINKWRKEYLNLPERDEPFSEGRAWNEQLHLLGYSDLVIPHPKDWGGNVYTTGYWRIADCSSFVPSTELAEFLENRVKPIYVGFGSMSYSDLSEIAQKVVRTLKQTGQRAIISFKEKDLDGISLSPNIVNVDSIPHDWLFPRLAAAVHHGGAGTTGSVLTAGIPSATIPFFSEQPFWGNRIEKLGVGPQPILKENVSVERLIYLFGNLVSNQAIKKRASHIGRRLRKENGLEAATKLIQEYIDVRQ